MGVKKSGNNIETIRELYEFIECSLSLSLSLNREVRLVGGGLVVASLDGWCGHFFIVIFERHECLFV